MSEPSAVWRAENKLYQLEVAASLGLPIPRTIVSNDPNIIKTTYQRLGSMIVKSVRRGYVDYGSEQHAIFTSRVLEEHLENIDSARWAPSIYQELVPKRYDVRVTIVGNELFAVEIDSQSDPEATIDWRKTSNPALPHRHVQLPPTLVRMLHNLVARLGLSFAAIDLIRTPKNQYVFLEVNPSGQWLWLDDSLGLGISDSIANWLAT